MNLVTPLDKISVRLLQMLFIAYIVLLAAITTDFTSLPKTIKTCDFEHLFIYIKSFIKIRFYVKLSVKISYYVNL